VKRAFYTDPLAAAWMEKHFRMRYSVEGLPHATLTALSIRALWASLLEGEDATVPDRYYIHPDSLHLLEPKKGDICKTYIGGGMYALEFYVNDDEQDTVDSILLRSNIAFHWREFEE
jgi:hypothetical protein